MAVLPFAAWLPDRPDLAEGTRYASGVIAITQDSYGPINSLQPFTTNQLPTQCFGLAAMEDVMSAVQTFAGTAKDLYLIPANTQAWTNVSATAGGYSAGSDNPWHIVQFNEIVVATDYVDPIQAYTMGSSTAFATLSTDAPKARYAAVSKQFLIVANTSDPVGGVNPARLWWSANGDPTNWPTPGSTTAQQTQSDYNDLLGPQGGITGLAPSLAGCDCAVFFERAVWQMFYVGPPDIFNFYPCAAVKGVPAPNSIVTVGETVFALFEDGFYSFDGASATPIGDSKVDRWFFSTVNATKLDQVIGAADVSNKAIIWLFQSNASLNNQPDTILIYRWDIQRFSWATLPAQWLARVPVPAQTSGLPPFETSLVAGQIQLAAIDQSGNLSYFTGLPLPAQVGTQAVQITPGRRSYLQGVRPLVNGGPPAGGVLTNIDGTPLLNIDGTPLMNSGTGPTITVAVSARNTYQDVEVLGPAVGINSMGECPQRADGRYHRAVANISGGLWDYAYGVDATAVRAGLR